MTTRTLPPTHRILRQMIADNAGVQAITTRVHNSRPANPQFPYVLVERIGGIPIRQGDDNASIQITAYGRTHDEAYALVQALWKSLMEYTLVHDEGVLVHIAPATGIQDIPDPVYRPPQPRYLFAVNVVSHS